MLSHSVSAEADSGKLGFSQRAVEKPLGLIPCSFLRQRIYFIVMHFCLFKGLTAKAAIPKNNLQLKPFFKKCFVIRSNMVLINHKCACSASALILCVFLEGLKRTAAEHFLYYRAMLHVKRFVLTLQRFLPKVFWHVLHCCFRSTNKQTRLDKYLYQAY